MTSRARVRSVVKSLLPPAATKAIIRLRKGRPKPVWQGVYPHRNAVIEAGLGFKADEWIQALREQLHALREQKARLRYVPLDLFDASVLTALCATIRPRVRVLDFGGGLGAAYESLRAGLADDIGLSYTVKELAEVVAAGNREHEGDPAIQFTADMPGPGERFDVVYVRTALQYVDDYPALLNEFASYRPRFVLFMTTSAVDGETFATAQLNHGGSRIGYWFHGQADLIRSMQALGYRLNFIAVHGAQDRYVDLPLGYDVSRPHDLVFERVEDGRSSVDDEAPTGKSVQ